MVWKGAERDQQVCGRDFSYSIREQPGAILSSHFEDSNFVEHVTDHKVIKAELELVYNLWRQHILASPISRLIIINFFKDNILIYHFGVYYT